MFKKWLPNPETQVLGWENLNYKKELKSIRGFLDPLIDHMNNKLMQAVDPIEIENSSKEFFIDFRGKNS